MQRTLRCTTVGLAANVVGSTKPSHASVHLFPNRKKKRKQTGLVLVSGHSSEEHKERLNCGQTQR